jgi:hypothetical protein
LFFGRLQVNLACMVYWANGFSSRRGHFAV